MQGDLPETILFRVARTIKSCNRFLSLYIPKSPVLHRISTISCLATMLMYYQQLLSPKPVSSSLNSKGKSFLIFIIMVMFFNSHYFSQVFQICLSGPEEPGALPNITLHQFFLECEEVFPKTENNIQLLLLNHAQH